MGVNPTLQPLQPEATGAAREVTKWVRREIGKEQGVQVPDNKGVANHVVPESCVACAHAPCAGTWRYPV